MKPIVRLFVIAFLLCAVIGVLCTTSYAEIPHQITYQGKLVDKNGNPIDQQTVSVTFRIYDSLTKPIEQALWSETQSVTPKKGMFSVMLGQTTPINLAFDVQYYLGLQVGTDSEMTPRLTLASAAYAIRAENAENVTSTIPITKGGTGSTSTQYCNLISNVAGILPTANGGTGITTSLIKIGSYIGNGQPGKPDLSALKIGEQGLLA